MDQIGVPLIPHVSSATLWRTRTLVDIARSVLTPDQSMVAVTLSLRDEQESAAVTTWDLQFRSLDWSPERPGSRWYALVGAGACVIEDLRLRWPVSALPPTIGVFSDGTGVGVAPADPDPRVGGWLLRQVGAAPTLRAVVAFDPAGAFAALQRSVTSHRLH